MPSNPIPLPLIQGTAFGGPYLEAPFLNDPACIRPRIASINFGAKMCSDICPRKLSLPRSKISEHIFVPSKCYCIYYIFQNTRSFENWDIPKF